jgi:hypothetical protein
METPASVAVLDEISRTALVSSNVAPFRIAPGAIQFDVRPEIRANDVSLTEVTSGKAHMYLYPSDNEVF